MTLPRLTEILNRLQDVRVGVAGDYCLDAYWQLDTGPSEISLETGKPTLAVAQQRYTLGGAGNVVTNIAALGVRNVRAFRVLGEDLFGWEMTRRLKDHKIDIDCLVLRSSGWETPVYAKPYLGAEEQNRVDFGRNNSVSRDSEEQFISALTGGMKSVHRDSRTPCRRADRSRGGRRHGRGGDCRSSERWRKPRRSRHARRRSHRSKAATNGDGHSAGDPFCCRKLYSLIIRNLNRIVSSASAPNYPMPSRLHLRTRVCTFSQALTAQPQICTGMPPVTPPAEYSSVVSSALHGNEKERLAAVEQIIAAHWKVLYKYLRARHKISPTVARTILMNFLDALQQKIFFEGFNETKFPVRVFLREKLDLFVASHDDRGDGAPSLPIDFTSAEEEFQMDQRVPGQSAEEYLESEWVRNVFTLAVEELNNQLSAEGKTGDFSLFLNHDLQDREGTQRAGLESIAKELGMPLNDAMNSLARTRQKFHRILIDLVRSFSASEAEFQKEMRAFSGL